jgi:hypothetical protein
MRPIDRREMTPGTNIDYQCFEELIRRLQEGGFAVIAQKLDEMLHRVAWTTGSELIGELGLEILAFQQMTPELPVELQGAMSRCMAMVKRIWPDIQRRS